MKQVMITLETMQMMFSYIMYKYCKTETILQGRKNKQQGVRVALKQQFIMRFKKRIF